MDYVLKTNALSKSYPKFTALSGLDMSVPEGSIYGFVGKNGAGKTTLMRILTGLQLPTGGSFEMYGVKNSDSGINKVRERMGAVVETPSIFLDLNAEDNLKMQYRVLGLPSFDGIKELLELVGLSDTGSKKAKRFSLGMRQRLGIAVALCGSPDFLALDEPVNGLDPQGIIEVRELIIKLNKERGITVLISSHILDELSRLATYYGFIDGGKMVRELSAEELENECRKYISIETREGSLLSAALNEMKLDYRMTGDFSAQIFGEHDITPLVMALNENGVYVKRISENEESLESFFLSLVGGEKHE